MGLLDGEVARLANILRQAWDQGEALCLSCLCLDFRILRICSFCPHILKPTTRLIALGLNSILLVFQPVAS